MAVSMAMAMAIDGPRRWGRVKLTVLKEIGDVLTHSGDRDLGHFDGLPVEISGF